MSTGLAGVPFSCQLVQAALLLLHPHLQLPQLLPCLLQCLRLQTRSSLSTTNGGSDSTSCTHTATQTLIGPCLALFLGHRLTHGQDHVTTFQVHVTK